MAPSPPTPPTPSWTPCQTVSRPGRPHALDTRYSARSASVGGIRSARTAGANPWDLVAFEEAVTRELEEGLVIRHASAPGFMLLKLAAFHDRGRDDPFLSPDLEDIIALVASRPTLVSDVAAARSDMRTFIREQIGILRARSAYLDLLAGHLANVSRDRSKEVFEATDRRLEELAE